MLLFFDGDRPVNVLPILGILVLLQIALLLLAEQSCRNERGGGFLRRVSRVC
jgi:hypothetical protein